MHTTRTLAAGAILWIGFLVIPAWGVDLQDRYPATLDFSPEYPAYDWTCGSGDVWKLKEFSFQVGDLEIELKESQVVLGHHDKNVLWAVVIPDRPGTIVNAPAGKGEQVTSVWVRLHPARLEAVFPPATVIGPGDAALLRTARRLAAYKLHNSWHTNGRPIVPSRGAYTIDLETREGPRRFFGIDADKPTVLYAEALAAHPFPSPDKLQRETALEVFDKVWNAFDREYAMFVVKPDVDWAKLRDEFRPRAAGAEDNFALADVLAEMLAKLKDLHVSVQVNRLDVFCYDRPRPLNANRDALADLIGKVDSAGQLSWGLTDDSIGYIAVGGLTHRALPDEFQRVLEGMAGTRGLIIDLRSNGGGSEPLALAIAGAFLDRERVYGKTQYRSGPEHEDLGPPQEQVCRPKGPWHYVGPVVVLQGQRTMSSAESFVMMLAQCPQVTTLGDRTAGSSGNPRQLSPGAGITVNLPRWNPLDAAGKPFDAAGIAPDVAIKAGEDAFRDNRDPVLEAALKRLREDQAPDGAVLRPRPVR